MLTLARRSNAIIRRRAHGFSSLKEFTPEELSKSQKYVEETLRSRTWVTYMLASYLPSQLRIHFYTIHLFDMELTKISENAREPSLGTFLLRQPWENLTFGSSLCTVSTKATNLSPSPYQFACTTRFARILSPRAILLE